MNTSARSVKRAFRHSPNSKVISPHSSSLPASIQTSLLSVGMRIRKSVSEGYQNTSQSTKPSQISDWVRSDEGSQLSHGPMGLIPYCGILRTGNLRHEGYNLDGDRDKDCDVDDFLSSQESEASTIPAPGGFLDPPAKAVGKRCYEDEDSESLLHPNPLGSHPPQQVDLPCASALRPILQPKTRKVSRVTAAREMKEYYNMMDVDDFGEASFLHFEDCMEQENERF